MQVAEITDGIVFLRPLLPDHVSNTYVSWLNDPETTRYTEIRHRSHDLASTRGYVEEAVRSPRAALWRICVSDAHVGNLRLSNIDQVHLRADIAILIGASEARGTGVGTRAIGLASGNAFADLGLRKLCAGIYADNIASRRAFEKAGYREEAILGRHAAFAGGRTDVVQMVRFWDDADFAT